MFEFAALGTRWWIEILDVSSFDRPIQDELLARVETFEDDYSRFKQTSLLSILSRDGEITNPPRELVRMLDFAGQLNQQTGGLFNPLVGGKLRELGYGGTSGEEYRVADFSLAVHLDNKSIRIAKGQFLDFGAFGKGWLIDELAIILKRYGLRQFIINGGGDILVQSNIAVEFALENPLEPGRSLGSIQLRSGALAASSTLKRAWSKDGKKYHHIIDPRSDQPSDQARASFVIADSALVADSIATIMVIDPQMETQLAKYYDFKSKIVR